MAKKKRIDLSKSGDSQPLNSPFAALGALIGGGADSPVDAEEGASTSTAKTNEPVPPLPRRVSMQTQRKGRGGKTVTVVTLHDADAASMQRWGAQAQRALGCGSTVEGDHLVFQGDQRARLVTYWRAQGVSDIRGA